MSAKQLVEDLFVELGLGDKAVPVPEASTPTWNVTKGSARIFIAAAEARVVVSAVVLAKARRDDAGLFYELLRANLADLKGAAFGLHKDDSVNVWQVRAAKGLTASVLAFMIGNVARIADEWDDKLKGRGAT